MFARIGNGFKIMRSTLMFVFRKPVFLIPVLFALVTSLLVNGFIIFSTLDQTLSDGAYVGLGFLVIFVSSFFISLAQLIILELLEQHETDGDMKLGKAIGEALSRDLLRALPIILIWSLIQFLIQILDALVSGGENGRSTFLERILRRLLSGIRRGLHWGVMLVLTALAWEDIKPKDAYHKAKTVYKKHFIEMLTGISISAVISLMFVVPVIIIIVLSSNGAIIIGPTILIVMMVWFVLIWCLGMIIEQIYTAELYLWYKVYEDEIETARQKGVNGPSSLYDVPRPTFFDDVPDMVLRNRNQKDTQIKS
jgi:hypothetical protein